MSAKILGHGMDDDIHAQGQGPLQGRRREGIVDHRDRPRRPRLRRHGRNIDDPQVRIGRAFEIDDARPAGQGRRPGLRIIEVDELHLDAELGQPLGEKGIGAAVEYLVADHPVTSLAKRPEGIGDRPHARAEDQRLFALLQARQPFLQEPLGRVHRPAVGIARDFAGVDRPALFGVLEGEGRGHVDRRGQRPPIVEGVVAFVNRSGGKARLLVGARLGAHKNFSLCHGPRPDIMDVIVRKPLCCVMVLPGRRLLDFHATDDRLSNQGGESGHAGQET